MQDDIRPGIGIQFFCRETGHDVIGHILPERFCCYLQICIYCSCCQGAVTCYLQIVFFVVTIKVDLDISKRGQAQDVVG